MPRSVMKRSFNFARIFNSESKQEGFIPSSVEKIALLSIHLCMGGKYFINAESKKYIYIYF